jgi:hypothetical protein
MNSTIYIKCTPTSYDWYEFGIEEIVHSCTWTATVYYVYMRIYVNFYVVFTHLLELKYYKEWDPTLENFQVYILLGFFLYVQPDDG